jgi:hypothetical protein
MSAYATITLVVEGLDARLALISLSLSLPTTLLMFMHK